MGMKSKSVTTDYINDLIVDNKSLIDTNEISDGYHTFGELYNHRCTLFVLLAKQLQSSGVTVWRSLKNSDGSVWDGWFLLGVGTTDGQQISYHLPVNKYWDLTEYAVTYDVAPKFDGHTPTDVLDRLIKIYYNM